MIATQAPTHSHKPIFKERELSTVFIYYHLLDMKNASTAFYTSLPTRWLLIVRYPSFNITKLAMMLASPREMILFKQTAEHQCVVSSYDQIKSQKTHKKPPGPRWRSARKLWTWLRGTKTFFVFFTWETSIEQVWHSCTWRTGLRMWMWTGRPVHFKVKGQTIDDWNELKKSSDSFSCQC